MKNQKGFASINKEDYSAKMRELKISYFMQCVDLTIAFNGDSINDTFRGNTREMVESFIKAYPEASFIQFCESLGKMMVYNGDMSAGEFADILAGEEIDY